MKWQISSILLRWIIPDFLIIKFVFTIKCHTCGHQDTLIHFSRYFHTCSVCMTCQERRLRHFSFIFHSYKYINLFFFAFQVSLCSFLYVCQQKCLKKKTDMDCLFICCFVLWRKMSVLLFKGSYNEFDSAWWSPNTSENEA